jgi:hypothetical protein
MTDDSQKGHFFAIDRRSWAKACDCGMNAAVAYLVLACGTGGDNRKTSWSAQAIHNYTGMAWPKGKQAIRQLIQTGLVCHSKDHTKERPSYELIPSQVNEGEIDLSGEDLIWLPNSIVKGTSKGETSPLHRLRSAGDVRALQLFFNLYHSQNLRDDGGISPTTLWKSYERRKLSEHGIYNIWAFKESAGFLRPENPAFSHYRARRARPHEADKGIEWRAITLLTDMGLLNFIPHLVESDSADAEVVHPLGMGNRWEEPIEAEIGEAARDAAASMCADWAMQNAENDDFENFCPVLRTLPNVQLIGIARLRYRPHTKMTSAWYAQLCESGKAAIEKYRKLSGSNREVKYG